MFLTPRPAEEFFDCRIDSIQAHNEVNNPTYAMTVADLRAVLARWQRETGDSVPEHLTTDYFDRETGKPLPTKNKQGEMPGASNHADHLNAKGPF